MQWVALYISCTLLVSCIAVQGLEHLGPDSPYTVAALADRVFELPGWGSVRGFKLFAGYITIGEGRNIFYTFAEAQRDVASAPLLWWLNGGPGCSSVGGGFLSELGPWFPTPRGDLQRNPYSWNDMASVLFIESPLGVGFSYSEHDEDVNTGDGIIAANSYAFLTKFYERFPQFLGNDLFLTGESYAGHYVPQLAWEIVKPRATAPVSALHVNFRGFLVGNPWTDTEMDNQGALDYWWTHALISDETFTGVRAHCNFSNIDFTGDDGGVELRLCQKLLDRAAKELGHVNMYDIYADVCLDIKRGGGQRRMAAVLQDHPAGLAARAAVTGLDRARLTRTRLRDGAPADLHTDAYTSAVELAFPRAARQSAGIHAAPGGPEVASRHSLTPAYDPCVDDEVAWYLNRPEVQKALHANQSAAARRRLPAPWSDCTEHLNYSRQDFLSSMLPLYHRLIAANLTMLVYSGDIDGNVPIIGTRRWVTGLGLQEKTPWRPWTDGRLQVGGFLVEYEGLAFASVRNAGHMVPYTQPERMRVLLKMFLAKAQRRLAAG